MVTYKRDMDMNKLYYITISLLAVILFGCTDEEKTYTGHNDEVRITGSLTSETRTAYETNGNSVQVSWVTGDAIGIMTAEDISLSYQAVTDGATVDFIPTSAALSQQDGEIVHAYYPYVVDKEKYPNAALPNIFNQYYNNDKLDPTSDFLYATATQQNGELKLQFKHLFAFFKVTIRTELLNDSWGIHVRSDETIAYYKEMSTPSYDFKGDSIKGTPERGLWYNIPEDMKKGKETITCYIAVLPTSEKNVISFHRWETDGYTTGIFEKKAPEGGFKAGHIYDLSIDENTYEKIQQQEREALVALYQATDGDNWVNNTNWCSDKPLNEWFGVNYWDGHVRGIYLSYNNLKGELPQNIGNLTGLYDLFLNNNELTGNLPEGLASLNSLVQINLIGNMFTGTIPDKVLQSDWWERLGADCIVYQKNGVLAFPMYESSDYSLDKTVTTLQRHTRGNGLKIVIMGEAYSDRMIADGTYRQHAEWAMEGFFGKEPYASFREYFDVYLLNLVSKNESLAGNTAFDTSYEFERGTFETNSELVREYVQELSETNYQTTNVSSIIMINSKAAFRSNCHRWYDGFSAAFCVCINENGLKTLVHHESCGHGFGNLADEYVEFEGVYPYPDAIREAHQLNEFMNVDVTDDSRQIVWSHYLTDMRYAKEAIGIFEGAVYHPKGIYRATENSIMRYNTGRFNAPSRQSIYRRIKELSGEAYRFEDFLEYDEINRQAIANEQNDTRNIPVQSDILLGAPPVYHNCPPGEEAKYNLNKSKLVIPFR